MLAPAVLLKTAPREHFIVIFGAEITISAFTLYVPRKRLTSELGGSALMYAARLDEFAN
jgi:hypothetical protein